MRPSATVENIAPPSLTGDVARDPYPAGVPNPAFRGLRSLRIGSAGWRGAERREPLPHVMNTRSRAGARDGLGSVAKLRPR